MCLDWPHTRQLLTQCVCSALSRLTAQQLPLSDETTLSCSPYPPHPRPRNLSLDPQREGKDLPQHWKIHKHKIPQESKQRKKAEGLASGSYGEVAMTAHPPPPHPQRATHPAVQPETATTCLPLGSGECQTRGHVRATPGPNGSRPPSHSTGCPGLTSSPKSTAEPGLCHPGPDASRHHLSSTRRHANAPTQSHPPCQAKPEANL